MAKKSSKTLILSLGLAAIGTSAFVGFQVMADNKGNGQKIIPPKVYYWLDAGNGGKGFMGAMANMPFMKGAGGTNSYGSAYLGMNGKHADIALQHKDFPRQISAAQAIPSGLKLGKSINLISEPLVKGDKTHEDHDRLEVPKDYKIPDFKVSFYWGCGAKAKAPPKVFQLKKGALISQASGIANRGDPSQHQNYSTDAALWPNSKDKRDINSSASLVGNHALSGANVPASLTFAMSNQQDFLGDLGLSSSGDKSGIITLKWNNVANAKAYYFNAMGMKDGEMVMWSASDVPDMGNGLLNYLSNAKVAQYLNERAILPASQNKCDIPSGIFANMQMVMVNGIGYGEETSMVYPARPADPKVTWVQEWAARFRTKTTDHLLVGMPSMGSMMQGENMPQMTPEEKARLDCEREKSKNSNVGSSLGGMLGGGLGSALGGALGKSKTKCPPN